MRRTVPLSTNTAPPSAITSTERAPLTRASVAGPPSPLPFSGSPPPAIVLMRPPASSLRMRSLVAITSSPSGPTATPDGARQPRLAGRPAVAELAAAARHRAEAAVGADVADDAVVDQAAAAEHVLGDVDAAVRRHRDVAREAQPHIGGGSALDAARAAAGEREHHAVRRDPLDAVLDALGDVDGAVVGDADADRRAEVGGQRADVAVGVDPAHHADARAVGALDRLGEVDGAVGADLGLAEIAEREVGAELAVALARDQGTRPLPAAVVITGSALRRPTVTQVDGVVARVEPVVRVERPAAERLVARIEAADRGLRLVAVLAPDDGVHRGRARRRM